ncbi:hypothetical protein ASPCAL14259 [Aspergillus calidoustus]|uniref:Transcription factor domain-containing protein n=1 Tax=Aspergillus calidoustus TaxID=454130 RepID=A0A0U5GFH1_ASPCI|nr:hypothetical protein ASPCAL14259 [Aspergillus calidoustus]
MISDGCGTITLQTGGSPNPFSETVQATRDLAGPKSPAANGDDAQRMEIASHDVTHGENLGDLGVPLSEPVRRKVLLDVYLVHVDPILKILHRPSLCAYLNDRKNYLGYPREHPVPAALAAAVFYMATSVLSETQCLTFLAEGKQTVLTSIRAFFGQFIINV